MSGAVSTKTLTSVFCRPRRGDDKGRELLELALDHIVIVAMARIDGNGPHIGAPERRQRIGQGAVIEAQHDDAPGVGHELARIHAALEGFSHPGHVAMRAVSEPGGKTFARLRRRIGRRDPASVEAQRARLLAQKRQKSRLA